MTTKTVVVSLSGGMDSATLLARCLRDHDEVIPVSFHYPSKHARWENDATENVANHYKLDRVIWFSLGSVFSRFKSNLLDDQGDIPDGHYEEKVMTQTVVPGRNAIFISVLTGYAQSIGASAIFLGIHSGDHAIYPDCRPEFASSMSRAIYNSSDGKVSLVTPFLYHNKISILRWGIEHDVPYQLTRTCYKDQQIACGKCGACQERLEAFKANEIEDPIDYESREILTKKG